MTPLADAGSGTIALSVAVPVAGALATAVAFLFRMQRNDWDNYREEVGGKLTKSEESQQKQAERIIGLTAEVGELRGRVGASEEFRSILGELPGRVEDLHDSMLEILTEEQRARLQNERRRGGENVGD